MFEGVRKLFFHVVRLRLPGATTKFRMVFFRVNQTYVIEFGEKPGVRHPAHVRVNRVADAEENLIAGLGGWRVAAATDIKTMTRCSSHFPPGPHATRSRLYSGRAPVIFVFFFLLYYIFFYLQPKK